MKLILYIIILFEKYKNLKSCFKIKSLTNKLGILSNDDIINLDALVSCLVDQTEFCGYELGQCLSLSLI